MPFWSQRSFAQTGRNALIELGLRPLTIDDVERVARRGEKVELSQAARQRIAAARKVVDDTVASGKAAYGISTGFGALKNKAISAADQAQLQKNFLTSHAVGVGNAFPQDVSRAILLISANGLSQGHSGVRLETVQAMLELLNHGVTPVIPEKGSVGASGDLAPLAHMAQVLTGNGDAYYQGKKMAASQALTEAGIVPRVLAAKEGLGLSNGTAVMTAVGALAVHDARILAETADVTAAMSLEALMGTDAALDERIHAAKPHAGQQAVAAHMRQLTKNSQIIASHKDCDRIQDAYSLRCTPQVHGASRDAIAYVKKVIETEMNSATDNPLIFENGQVISGGNFHGQPVALAMDFLGIAVAELANISERRIFRLVDPKLNEGLPAFLIQDSGLNTGYMIVQYTAAALVSENKVLAHPASVDSIPTCANQEDHVSMGTIASRKAAQIIDNVQHVLAIEALCAAQALDFRLPLTAGNGTKKAHDCIRQKVPHVDADRPIQPDILAVTELVRTGQLAQSTQNQG
ncbi:histidine ammonia-lyase [Candidatus Micrarchaeota archaeon]|nr:histidine ammonia-lyase [Candidatus Micrarchaeota archaeon]